MATVRESLEQGCTQMQFVPPGITGLCQPMDVAVMKPFKDAFRKLYLEHHLDNPFPTSTSEKRVLISRFAIKAWEAVKPDTILRGFARAGVVPTGPRDRDGRRVAVIVADALLVQDR
ncbi:uncharacterized protein KRP23_14406 [Phytophthora ramorum]|uniref:DDE-1 domain-containing protein n=1 Tax=Phytophthora ramorum TaxID=164328 RepID=H3GUJ9_PHYRM|nr:hypothetical protein KRP23_14811 [Phytophthora ramorum]KAH7460700.1 hypothetical protein KRP23_14406 [Phytophthora ramorum]